MRPGRIVIISGPSGSGKTTLSERLLLSRRLKDKLVKSISVTTRPRRKDERHGRDYFFVSKEKFLAEKKAGHFLEWQKVFVHYYGTPYKNVKSLLKKGQHVLLCIDVKGAKVVLRKHPEALRIFVAAPSLAALSKRLKGRATEKNNDVRLRLKVAREEMKQARNYDYVLVNDRLERACRELEDVVVSELSGQHCACCCA